MKPTFVSLFAGIGGFDLGLERAGMQGVGQVEINPYCREVLATHWPEVPRHDDVKTAVEWWTETDRPEVDVVCGGFPCQDISLAKAERKGLDGDRSGLYWEALGFVVAVQPRLVLLENVEGLLSSNSGRDLALIQATMAECGYPYFEWRVLDSQFFGVPQRRVRVFLVASARDPRLGPLLLEPEGRGRDLEALGKARQKSARAASRIYDPGVGAGDEGGAPADPDGVREAAGLPGRVDHLGETARTLLAKGNRFDQDSDNFVAEPTGPDGPEPGDQLAAHRAGDRTGQPVAPRLAATLTHGGHSDGVSAPGRRKEDDVNLVAPNPLNDPASTLTAHIGHAYSSARGDGSDNLIFHLPTTTLQGSVQNSNGDPNSRRGSRLDAEGAAGGQLVVPAVQTPDPHNERYASTAEPAARGPIADQSTLYDAMIATAVTKNSFGYAGVEVKTAQANHLVVTEQAQRGVYARYRNAQSPEDDEAWSEATLSRTLNRYENTDVRTPHAVLDQGVQPEGGCGCCPNDPAPDANRFGTCGNAVSVPVITWIGHRFWDELVSQHLAEREEERT